MTPFGFKSLLWFVVIVGLILAYEKSGKRTTADQLFGCTYEQTDAATGECR